jgi:hypothetical protein
MLQDPSQDKKDKNFCVAKTVETAQSKERIKNQGVDRSASNAVGRNLDGCLYAGRAIVTVYALVRVSNG